MVIDLVCHLDTDACNTREVCGRPNAHSLVIYNTLFQLLIGADIQTLQPMGFRLFEELSLETLGAEIKKCKQGPWVSHNASCPAVLCNCPDDRNG